MQGLTTARRDSRVPVTHVDSFEPDYETACEQCGARPTVTAWKYGRLYHHTGRCGPCCWGDDAMADPRNWE
jgi:hypothetical protein